MAESDVIRNVIIRLKLEQVDGKITAPDTSAMKAAEETVRKESEKTTNKIEEETKKQVELRERAVEEIGAAQSEIADNNLKAFDSFKMVGEGAFTAMRGIALSTIDAEDELAKTLETIAKFQAGFDIFKGGTDIIKGAVDGWRAIEAASNLAAAANTTLAASNTEVAVTGAAATASTRSFTLALLSNPITAIAVAISAAVAGLIAWTWATRDATKAEEELQETIKKRNRGPLQGDMTEPGSIATERSQATRMASIRDQQRSLLDNEGKLRDISRERAETEERIALAREAIRQRRADLPKIVTEDQLDDYFELGLEDLERQIEANQRLVMLARQQVDVRNQQFDLQRQSLQAVQDEIRERRRLRDEEEARVQSIEARLGRLDALQQARISSIFRKDRDDVTAEDVRFVEQNFGEVGTKFGEEFFSKRGRSLRELGEEFFGTKLRGDGSELESRQLGLDTAVFNAQRVGVSAADANEALIKINEQFIRIESETTEAMTRQNSLLGGLLDRLEALQTSINGLENRNERLAAQAAQ